MNHKIMILNCFMLFTLIFTTTSADNFTEAQALLRWKHSLLTSDSLSLWGHYNTHNLCNWTGIICDNFSHLSSINLTNQSINGTLTSFNFHAFTNLTKLILNTNMLHGQIPPSIGNLSKLIYLDLSNNMFEGFIPVEIGQLLQLEFLNLNNNDIGDAIPVDISKFRSLRFLDIGSNKFTSPDWSKFSIFPSLSYLSFGYNNFHGELPSFIFRCNNLTYLDLSKNKFSGVIPEALFINLTKLKHLDLSDNSLRGQISPKISQLSNLTKLLLSSNHINGSIPESIGLVSSLEFVELFSNSLSGKIPSSIGQLKHLNKLDLRWNGLGSVIPSELGLCTELTYLSLAGNSLTGELPLTLSNLRNISELDVSQNQLSGELSPFYFTSWTKLTSLPLQNNQFSGTIPQQIGHLKKLQNLDLSTNHLSGPIPSTIGDLRNLSVLNLFSNHLSGRIPSEIGKLTSLTILVLHSNQLDEIPSEIRGIPLLKVLDLGSNELSGNIPNELGDLGHLSSLTLSNNLFTGEIPQSIGNLQYLELLDLSENNLSGEIPAVLGNFTMLSSLSLGQNSFTGKIPAWIGHLTTLQLLLDLSSNSLSGSIPQELDKLMQLQNLNLSNNHLTGEIPPWLSSMSSLWFFDLSYNKLSGELPNDSFFQRGLFEGNPDLCGRVIGLFCDFKSHRKTKYMVVETIVPIVSVFFLTVCVVASLLFCPKYNKQCGGKTKEGDFESFICKMEKKFRFSEIIKATDNFSEAYCIGKGGFGRVYRACLSSGDVFAVKELRISDSSNFYLTNRQNFLQEIKTLTEVIHRNIIKLYGYGSRKGSMYLVYDYAERGSLGEILGSEESAVELGWERRLRIVKRLADAIAYLHNDCTPTIIHRDISINNILLDYEFEPKLSDFGTAKVLCQDTFNFTMIAGTYGYMAPELALTIRATEKCDVYSYGVVALQVMIGKHPGELLSFSNKKQEVRLNDILDQRLSSPTRQLQVAKEVVTAVRLALLCTSKEPASRPTMRYVAQELSAQTQSKLSEPFETIVVEY